MCLTMIELEGIPFPLSDQVEDKLLYHNDIQSLEY